MAQQVAQDGATERRGWTTRDIVVAAALAVALGLIWVGWTQVWLLGSALLGPAAGMFLGGFWIIGGVLVPYIIRKPGSAIFGEVVAAFAQMPFTIWSVSGILSGVVEALPCELVFLATRYRKFGAGTLMLAAAAGGAVFYVYYYVVLGQSALAIEIRVAYFALRVLGAAVLAGLGSKVIGDALVPTGVLNGFPIARERQKEI